MRPLDIEAPTARPGNFAQPPPREEWSTGTRRVAFLTMLLPLAIGLWAQPAVLGPLVLGLIFWGLPERTTERTYLAAWVVVIVAVALGAAWEPAGRWERTMLEMDAADSCCLGCSPEAMARRDAERRRVSAILVAHPDMLPPTAGSLASFSILVLLILSPAFYAPGVVLRRRRRRRARERAKTQATTF